MRYGREGKRNQRDVIAAAAAAAVVVVAMLKKIVVVAVPLMIQILMKTMMRLIKK